MLFYFACEAAGASAPGIPHALPMGTAETSCTTRAHSRRENADVCVALRRIPIDVVIASAAKQSSFLLKASRWIASLRSRVAVETACRDRHSPPVVPANVFGPGRLGRRNRCRARHRVPWGAPCVMELNLHANATTTPKVRAYIQRSRKAVAELAGELGISETTVRRWRGRTTAGDRSHRPHRLTTNLSAMEETLVCELRTALQLPLDDIVEVMRRCINGSLSRSAIHRCLQRHGISQRKKPARPSVGIFEQASVGFIHFDLKHLPALERRKSYAFVAIDRATRYVYVEIHPRRDAQTSAGFLKRSWSTSRI